MDLTDLFDRIASHPRWSTLYILGCWLVGAGIAGLALLALPDDASRGDVAFMICVAVAIILMYPLLRRSYLAEPWSEPEVSSPEDSTPIHPA